MKQNKPVTLIPDCIEENISLRLIPILKKQFIDNLFHITKF